MDLRVYTLDERVRHPPAMAVGAASVGAGELGQSLMGAGISAAPATLGGPTGAALGPTVTVRSGRKDSSTSAKCE
jgi:hypothetical protein